MTDLIPFSTSEYDIRVIMIDGEPWFVAKDVCDALDIVNVSQAASQLDEDERGVSITDTPSGQQNVVIISESGLYSLILRSRKPEAKAFKRWITHEVLPTIRKTGGAYIAPGSQIDLDLANDPDAALDKLIEVAKIAKETRAQLVATEAARVEAERYAQLMQRPAEAWLNLAEARGDYSVNDASHMLNADPSITTGETRLRNFMLDRGWIRYVGRGREKHPAPYQTQVDAGRLFERPGKVYWDDTLQCNVQGNPQVRVTMKGVRKLHELLGGSEPVQFMAIVPDEETG